MAHSNSSDPVTWRFYSGIPQRIADHGAKNCRSTAAFRQPRMSFSYLRSMEFASSFRLRMIAPCLILLALLCQITPSPSCGSWQPGPSELQNVLTKACLVLAFVAAAIMRQKNTAVLLLIVGFLWALFPQPRTRSACVECAAVANLRTINTAEVTYASATGGSFGDMTDLIDARLLDDSFQSCKTGYWLGVTVSESGYIATATPVSKKTGRYGYFSTSDAVVRYQRQIIPNCEPCFPSGKAGEPVQ